MFFDILQAELAGVHKACLAEDLLTLPARTGAVVRLGATADYDSEQTTPSVAAAAYANRAQPISSCANPPAPAHNLHSLRRGPRRDDRTPEDPARQARLQSLGRERDAGRFRAAFHGQECAAVVVVAGLADSPGCHLVPGPRSHRRQHHAILRFHQRGRSHAGGRRRAIPDGRADQLLRGPIRRRRRPPDPWRWFRLYRLHRHVAGLCHVHLHALRHRGVDHVDGLAALLRRAAAARLSDQCRGRDPARHPWHQLDQPFPDPHPAAVDRPQHPARGLHRLERLARHPGMDAFHGARGRCRRGPGRRRSGRGGRAGRRGRSSHDGRAGGGRTPRRLRPPEVRRRRLGDPGPDAADRRTGRRAALPAGPITRRPGRQG